MSTTNPLEARSGSFDVSGTAPVPFTRHVTVELRKLVDTRAGRWLLIIMAALIALGGVIYAWAERNGSVGFFDFTSVGNAVMGILLPVLAIMSVTTEWSQRTNMATFTLEPRRPRVVFAKLAATVIAALVSVVVAVAAGAPLTALASAFGANVNWDLNIEGVLAFALAQVLGLLVGFALGALLLNTPAAIVLFFAYFSVIPGLMILAGAYFDWFEDIRPWIDFTSAQGPLAVGFENVDWAQLGTSGLLWVALPLVLGIMRILKAEVK